MGLVSLRKVVKPACYTPLGPAQLRSCACLRHWCLGGAALVAARCRLSLCCTPEQREKHRRGPCSKRPLGCCPVPLFWTLRSLLFVFACLAVQLLPAAPAIIALPRPSSGGYRFDARQAGVRGRRPPIYPEPLGGLVPPSSPPRAAGPSL